MACLSGSEDIPFSDDDQYDGSEEERAAITKIGNSTARTRGYRRRPRTATSSTTAGGEASSSSMETTPSQEGDVMGKLNETIGLISQLTEKVRGLEQQLETQRSGCGARREQKTTVPLVVRREVRHVYNMLLSDDYEFPGWKIESGTTFKSNPNQVVVNRLLREVKGLFPDFLTEHISAAAYRYYRSCCEETSLQRRGKDKMKQKQSRRYERMSRKLDVRKATIKKMTFREEGSLEQWQGVLKIEMVSSEESEGSDSEVLFVKPLPWRSGKVERMFAKLDKKVDEEKSAQAKCQSKRRVIATAPSDRPQPQGSLPRWAFKK